MWCRPEPSSVSPMYMPGRLRTASRPFSTLIESAPYSSAPVSSCSVSSAISIHCDEGPAVDADALGAALQAFKERFLGSGQKNLEPQRGDFVEEGGPAARVQVGRDFVQQQYRIRLRNCTRK